MLTYRLYLELLFVGLILLLILFINNMVLYKHSIRDRISMMLISDIAMSIFEIIWAFFVEHPNPRLNWLHYIAACGYCISFIIFAMLLNLYLVELLGIRLRKIRFFLGYGLPFCIFFILCFTTPLTHLLVWVDGDGGAQDGVLLYSFFPYFLLFYILSPAFIGAWFLSLGKKKKPSEGAVSLNIFVFSAMVPLLYYLEILFMDDSATDYQTLSLPVSIALMYLITNVSTHNALDNRARVEAVKSDLRMASKIQTGALPPASPEFSCYPDLELRCSISTAGEVGGDFYDYFPINEKRLCFLIADVSGKGAPAALFMMTTKTMIKDYSLNLTGTAEIFTAVNARVCEVNKAGMFVTAWIGILDTETLTLQYTNAGHNYPLLKRRKQPCEIIKKVHGLFLGGMDFTKYGQNEIQLEPGDRLLLYTDGVVEAHDRDNKLYGDERLKSMLDSTGDLPGDQVLERIFTDVNEYAAGVPQFDDITMVVLSVKDKKQDRCQIVINDLEKSHIEYGRCSR